MKGHPCRRHWDFAAPELKRELRRAWSRGRAPAGQALVRLLGELHSRAELAAVPAPPDCRGFLAGCGCRSCAGSLAAALRCRGVPELAWVAEWWSRQPVPDVRLVPAGA